ncbi:Uncharacterized protein FWK35_00027621 [Aphis craccivora]|uniref:Uncharacterized protein n=1 Tax=Aphis craccivora TaxID=307492 RepID=A0A6G0Z3A2_APHCR|nr:Uncharacterized protein FWK35_00027621 [Aphis craccivora]
MPFFHEFKNEPCLTTLYTTLVIPISELCSVLWNPLQISFIKSLERVQRRFLCFIAYKRKLHVNFNLSATISLSSTKSSLNLDSLDSMLKSTNICFMRKLIKGIISCPNLLHSLNCNVP